MCLSTGELKTLKDFMKILYHRNLLLNCKKLDIYETKRISFFVTLSFKISVLFNSPLRTAASSLTHFFANCPSLWCIIVVFHAAWINLKAWYQNISCNLYVYSYVVHNAYVFNDLTGTWLSFQILFRIMYIVTNCYHVLVIFP